MTGGRVARAAKYLAEDDETFFLTYGDSVTDLNIPDLLRHHLASGKLATITAIHPAARFGEMTLRGDLVTGFEEKPAKTQGYINGGYMVLSREFIDRYLTTDEQLVLERDPMSRAVADCQLQVFRHEGFWQCMDTPREHTLLNELWSAGHAPWTRYWK